MRATYNDDQFMVDMNRIFEYSLGFLDGVKRGKGAFMDALGESIKDVFGEFVDSNARVDPASLSHMYEWYQAGNPGARLYDLTYKAEAGGLSFGATFRQSKSFKENSNTPFYSKARIMEKGIPVTIKPKNAEMLAFEVDGEQVFTHRPVKVNNPGGDDAQGGFENIFRLFFAQYVSQSVLMSAGLNKYLRAPKAFHDNFGKARTGGRTLGLQVGYNWIAKAGEQI